jgi:hypothetical protein
MGHSEIRDVSILWEVEACPCTLVLDCHAVIGSTSSGVLNMPSWYFTLSRLI